MAALALVSLSGIGNAALIPKTGWTVEFVSSEEVVGGNTPATQAFDGNPTTIWHTKWFNGQDAAPHELQIDLGAAYSISQFRYLPRQDSSNGRVGSYRLFVSQDGVNWGAPVAQGLFANNRNLQTVSFPATAGRYFSIVVLGDVSGGGIASIAEIDLDGQILSPFRNEAPDSFIIDKPASLALPVGGQADFSGFGLDVDGGEPFTYLWNFGLGSGIADATVADPPPVTFNTAGEFTVTFAVRDTGNLPDATPDSVRVKVGPSLLDRSPWSLWFVDSEETVGSSGFATNAFDSKANTIWHTKWFNGTDPGPHELQIDLGASFTLNEFRYLPRQDNSNGRIKDYRFFVSQDGQNWGAPVASGVFANSAAEKVVTLPPTSGRYVAISADSEVNGGQITTAAEVNLLGQPALPEQMNLAPDGVITSHPTTYEIQIGPGGIVDFAGVGLDLNQGQELAYQWNFGTGSGISNSTLANPNPVQFMNEGNFTTTFTVTDPMGASDLTPDIRIVKVGVASLPSAGWSILSASTQETIGSNTPASNLFDGKNNTFWHSKWLNGTSPLPHEIILDLGASYTLSAFTYLPRQDSANGRVGNFAFFVGQDGVNWGTAAVSGTFPAGAALQVIPFTPVSGRYVRFLSYGDLNGAPNSAIAELGFRGFVASPNVNHAPDSIIVSPAGSVSIPPGGSVEFAGLGADVNSGQALSYAWDFGSNSGVSNSASQSPGTITFPNEGTFEVTFTVTDDQGLTDPTPAKRTVVVGTGLINRSLWTIHGVSSEQASVGLTAAKTIDGNSNTFWHSQYAPSVAQPPHWIVYDLGANHTITGLEYLPRQDISNGRPSSYDITVSQDGIHWGGAAKSGNFINSKNRQTTSFPAASGRYVRITTFNDVNNSAISTIAEIDLLGYDATPSFNHAPDSVITSPVGNIVVAPGDEVSFSGLGLDLNAEQSLTYHWNFGIGSGVADSTLLSPGTIQFNNPGTYTVSFTATDNLGLSDPTPATVTITVGNSTLNKANFSILTSNSFEASLPPARAIDGNPSTFWHSRFSGGTDPLPHEIVVDLGASYTLGEMRYLPRQDLPNGRIGAYEVVISQDGLNFGGPAASGTFPSGAAEQVVPLVPATGRYVKLRSFGDANGNPATTAAELDFSGISPSNSINQAPDGVINTPSADISIGVGASVNFTSTGLDYDGDLPLSYAWNFGSGSGIPASSLKNPGSRTFANAGTFDVTLTVTDAEGLVDPTPHTIRVTVGSAPLDRSSWTVKAVSSQETVAINAPATRAFDGNPATYWHSKYTNGVDPHPHTIDIDLGAGYIISGFTYLGRQDASNGRVAAYRIYVSQDGIHWGAPAAQGVLANVTSMQSVNFSNSVAGRFLRFVSLSDVNGTAVSTMAEFNVLGQPIPPSVNQAPDGIIDTPVAEVSISPGAQVNFSGTGLDIDGNTPLSYHWNFGAGSGIPDSALKDPGVIQFNSPGVFTVILTVTDSLGLADPTPHTVSVVVTASDGQIGQGGWTLLGASSEETVALNGVGAKAFDGDPNTFWHSRFTGGTDPLPHTLDIDLGSNYNVAEFRYLPRQDLSNGRIGDFAIHFSADGVHWGAPVASGVFPNSPTEQVIKLPGLPARYLRLVGNSDVNGNPVSAVAEINLVGQPRSAAVNDAPHGWIIHPDRLQTFQIRQGDTVKFAAAAVDTDGDSPLTYRWNFGANSGIPEQTKLQPDPVIFNNPGNHTVTFTVTDARGYVNQLSDTRLVRVESGGPTNFAPESTIDYPYSEIAIPVGGTVNLSGSGADPNGNSPLTYRWEYGTGSGIADQTVATPAPVQYLAAGIYTLRFTVTDSLGLADPTPATVVVRVGSNVAIPRSAWALSYVDSQETVGASFPASNILDGNNSTFWHTAYTGGAVPGPHEFQIDLGARYPVSGFRYLPRQDSPNGRVANYRFFVSEDGTNWGLAVAQGTFTSSAGEEQVTFTGKPGRYVRFIADSEVNGSVFTTMAEFNVLQSPPAALPAPAAALANVPEAAGYKVVYQLNPAATNDYRTSVPYVTDNSLAHPDGTFERVAYYVELDSKWVWVSFDALSESARATGVPVAPSHWQQRKVRDMNVFASGNTGLVTGTGLATGNVEFWATNYGVETTPRIPGGSTSAFDFNDTFANFGGYGTMQIHNHGAGQTLFGFNNWNTITTNSDLGIGNAAGANTDWTFAANAGSYGTRRIYVLVKPGKYDGQADVTYTAFPQNGSLVARSTASNKATVPIIGTETRGGFEFARLRVFRQGVPYGSVLTQDLVYNTGAATFSFAPTIDAELAEYDFQLSFLIGPVEVPIRRGEGIVAGDAFIVNGQSNADAQLYNGSAYTYEDPFVRTYGFNSPTALGTVGDRNWRKATGDGSQNRIGGIGQWALVMANHLVSQHGVPVAVINGAHGGQEIGFFQRDDSDPENLSTNYGRLLHRIRMAGLQDKLRGAFFYQGEADVDNAPIHDIGFREMLADLRTDYPSLENTFVFQVREGCGVTRFEVDLRDVQRRLPDRFSDLSIMASNGINPHDSCHFAFSGGYETIGMNIYHQVANNLYGTAFGNVEPPNPASVQRVGANQLRITFRDTDDAYTFEAGAANDFKVIGAPVTVTAGTVTGNQLLLTLSGDATTATRLVYGGRQFSGQWVTNASGVGMLSFSEPILAP